MTEQDRRVAAEHNARIEGVETKPSTKTSELIVYAVAVLAVLLASYLVDTFDAFYAWQFVTYLTIGYLVSRGLAKSGSRTRFDS